MADDVVMVGMACRYPEAADPQELWQSVLSRRRSFRPLPPQRLPLAEYGGEGVDQTYLTHAAVLEGWAFDRERFRIPGAAYRAVDLTHWLALETTAAALADAGLPDGAGTDRARVGVVFGNSLTGEFSRAALLRVRWPYVRRTLLDALRDTSLSTSESEQLLSNVEHSYKARFPEPSDETLAGGLANTIAGRICNHFDFHGTGYTVDGACASSLIAVCTAAEAVAAGRLDVALAGGVDLSLDPFEMVGFARLGALARTEMRVYDARPTGFLPGEGCGVVVLCRRSYAERRGLRPYARLLGWGTSSDGTGGLTRPELSGQQLALRRAYTAAGLEPGMVELVEGHGTGTEVGDAVELRALVEVRGGGSPRPAVLGSVKANIGHTKAAAGAAGLIKAALAVHHEILPPTTGCERPHPLLAAAAGGLRRGDEAQPWTTPDRYAAVSAMGFGGINAHLVLGGAAHSTRRTLSWRERRQAARHPGREVVACAASSAQELATLLTRVRDAAGTASRAELTDLAATLAGTSRGASPARFAAAVAGTAELVAVLERALGWLAAGQRRVLDRDGRAFLVVGGALRVGLLFSGQGSPCYPDPGALRELVDALPSGYRDDLCLPADGAVDTAVAQPAIVRAALAGLRWLDALGVRADAAVGHSLGEIPALVWAGALDEDGAYRLARERGAAMSAASPAEAGMASLRTDRATAADLLAGSGAVIAADNAVDQVVVSGERAQVERVVATASRRGVDATWLPVRQAFHSPLMRPAGERVRAAARGLTWRPPVRPLASTVTGDWWHGDDPAEVLTRQLTAPVRFREALGLLATDLLVEVGPGRVLSGLAGAVPMDCGAPGGDDLATATAALFAAGACDGLEPYFARRASRPFDLARTPRFIANPCEAAPDGRVDAPRADTLPVPASATGPEVAGDPATAVVARLAAALELDPAAVAPDARLLADLHLTSLAVTQLASETARDLGRALPAAPLALAGATVAEFAATIAGLPPADATAVPPAAGVAAWVRAMGTHLTPRPVPQGPRVARRWEVVGDLARHPLADAIRAGFPADPSGVPARLLALAPGPGTRQLDDVVAALRACDADGTALAVLHHGGIGAAVGRSLAAERPDIPVYVLEVPADETGIGYAAREAHRDWPPYTEAVYHADGVRTVPVVRPMEVSPRRDDAVLIGPGELCLVSGGGKGIGVDCAVAVARVTGARIALLGRSDGGEQVRAALDRIAGAGAQATYHRVDVTDADAVRARVADLRRCYGPVRGLLHLAGRNSPARIAELTVAKLRETLAPKADGLEHLLSCLDTDELRVAVTFGSVIGRMGLAGEADYAIANEYLARRCAELSSAVPHVRWLNIEWSAWAGSGMGVRLGVLDGLIRQGLTPIPPDAGADLLIRLLATPALPPSVVVAGRLPAVPTLAWDDEVSGGGARFLEARQSHTPGVELVVDANLSLGSDPYLTDHRIDGIAVLPAVFGLEAIAQACAALGAKPVPSEFTAVALSHPVTVPERDNRVVRVAALVRESDGTDAVVRSEESGYALDHFQARYADHAGDQPMADPVHPGQAVDAQPLYGGVFFHGPRFQRVRGYHALSAYRCAAAIQAEPDARWFGAFHDQRLELGDPGARDAFVHALQACVPDRRVLPVGVERITVYRRPEGRLTLQARQRAETADTYLFDVVVSDGGRLVVEEWRGLSLRAVGTLPVDWQVLPVGLLGPYLTRALRRWRPEVDIDLAVTPARRTDRRRVEMVAGWLAGTEVRHTVDGRLVVTGPGTAAVSASHLHDHVLLATAAGPVAVDWERVVPGMPLDDAAAALADALARHGGGPERAAGQGWVCREVLSKLGQPPGAPLVLQDAGPDGWFQVGSGPHRLYTTTVERPDGAVALCVGRG